MVTNIYVNLPVKNLPKTKKFFQKIGLSFNAQFTDKNAACLVIGKNIFAMLITEKIFKTFTKKKIANAKKETEVLLALQVRSRKEVDTMAKKAVSAGGKIYRTDDIGWMYTKCIMDLDNHQWEVFWMNEKKMPKS